MQLQCQIKLLDALTHILIFFPKKDLKKLIICFDAISVFSLEDLILYLRTLLLLVI